MGTVALQEHCLRAHLPSGTQNPGPNNSTSTQHPGPAPAPSFSIRPGSPELVGSLGLSAAAPFRAQFNHFSSLLGVRIPVSGLEWSRDSELPAVNLPMLLPSISPLLHKAWEIPAAPLPPWARAAALMWGTFLHRLHFHTYAECCRLQDLHQTSLVRCEMLNTYPVPWCHFSLPLTHLYTCTYLDT